MTMRIICACLIGLFFMTMPVFAQDQSSGGGHQPPSADEIVAKMQSKLNLTQDQVTAITPIIANYASKFQALRQQVEDGTLEKSDMRSQMKDLRDSEKEELGQVLSADQLSQWEQMQKSGGHKHSGMGGGSEPGGSNGEGGSSGSGE